jgi:hypothetical protein
LHKKLTKLSNEPLPNSKLKIFAFRKMGEISRALETAQGKRTDKLMSEPNTSKTKTAQAGENQYKKVVVK